MGDRPRNRDAGQTPAQHREHECNRLLDFIAMQDGKRWSGARGLWLRLVDQMPALTVPAALSGEDEAAQLAWSSPRLYVEVEVTEELQLRWYARDLVAGQSGAGDGSIQEPPAQLLTWLERLKHV